MFNKTKITALLTGAALLIAQAAAAVGVSAAEKSTAPWSFYTASSKAWEDMSQWHKLQTQQAQEANAYDYYGEGSGAKGHVTTPVIRMLNGKMRIVPTSDAKAQGGDTAAGSGEATGRGSFVVAFTVPYNGDWRVEGNVYNTEDPGGDAGYFSWAVMSGNECLADESETAIKGSGEASKISFDREISLLKGETLAMRVRSSGDNYKRNFVFDYKISDAENEDVFYDIMSAGTSYTVIDTQSVFNCAENAAVESQDKDSVWSVNYANDIDNDKVYTIANWDAPKIDNGTLYCTFNADTSVYPPTSTVMLTPGMPNGTFRLTPNGAANNNSESALDRKENAKYNAVIGWKAPYSGEFVIDFDGINFGTGYTENTIHMLAYAKPGDEEITSLERFNMAPGKTVLKKQWVYSLEEGESIYLVNDAGGDSNGGKDKLFLRYKITDTNDTGKMWDFSKYKSQRLENYRFSTFTSKKTENTTFKFTKDKYTQNEENIIASASGNAAGTYTLLNKDGTINMVAADGYRNAIAFDVPETGYYKIELDAENAGSGSETGTALEIRKHGAYASDNADSTLSNSTLIANATLTSQKESVSEIIELDKNDRIWLTNAPVASGNGIDVKARYVITKINSFDVSYISGGGVVSSASAIEAGADVTAKVTYIPKTTANYTVVFAAYKAGKLIKAAIADDVEFSSSDVQSTPVEMTLPQGEKADSYKVFLLESLKSMKPVEGADILK